MKCAPNWKKNPGLVESCQVLAAQASINGRGCTFDVNVFMHVHS